MMKDICRYTRQSADSLAVALRDVGGTVEQWPVTGIITWLPPAQEWLARDPAGERQTEVVLELVAASASEIVVFVPGAGAPSACEARVKFEAQVDVRTKDGVLDDRAQGRFITREAGTKAQLRVDRRPAMASSPGTKRSISVALDVTHSQGEPAKVEILGHETMRTRSLTGVSTTHGGEVVLGSNVEPLATPSIDPRGWSLLEGQ